MKVDIFVIILLKSVSSLIHFSIHKAPTKQHTTFENAFAADVSLPAKVEKNVE